MPRKIAVYVRVSTDKQNHESQEPDLQQWITAYAGESEVAWYKETYTGKTMNRPVMQMLEHNIKLGMFNKLVVWRLDRLGRTASQTLRFLDALERQGVTFVSVKDGVDASTATGRLMRTILAGFAEYEREVICERVQSGCDKARAAGKKWGGRKKGDRTTLTPQMMESITILLDGGMKKTAVAANLKIDRSTVYEAVKLLKPFRDAATPPAPR